MRRYLHRLLQVRAVASPDIICLGDSLTVNSANFGPQSIYSYPSILSKLSGLQIGVSGGPGMFLRDMEVTGPTILWAGTNDLASGSSTILDDAQRLARPDVLFLNIIWRGDADDEQRRELNRQFPFIFDRVVDVASVVRPEHYHKDRIHLNHKGNRAIAEAVYKFGCITSNTA